MTGVQTLLFRSMDREGEIIRKTLIPLTYYLIMAAIIGTVLISVGWGTVLH